jgi:hypothetical protein
MQVRKAGAVAIGALAAVAAIGTPAAAVPGNGPSHHDDAAVTAASALTPATDAVDKYMGKDGNPFFQPLMTIVS